MNNNKKRIIIYLVMLIIAFSLVFLIIILKNNRPFNYGVLTNNIKPITLLDEYQKEIEIKKYLVDKLDKEEKNYNTEKAFVNMKIYDTKEITENKLYYIYAWVVSSKYYLESNSLKESVSSSIPYKFEIEKENDKYKVINIYTPRDGSYYKTDMEELFPKNVIDKMKNVQTDGTVKELLDKNLNQAKEYFNK